MQPGADGDDTKANRQGAKSWCNAPSLAAEDRAELLAGLEVGDELGGHLHLRSSPWVAAGAGAPLAGPERPEAPQLDLLAPPDCLHHAVEHHRENLRSLAPRQPD